MRLRIHAHLAQHKGQPFQVGIADSFQIPHIPDMKLLFKVNPEADSYLVQRDIQVVAKSIMFGEIGRASCRERV